MWRLFAWRRGTLAKSRGHAVRLILEDIVSGSGSRSLIRQALVSIRFEAQMHSLAVLVKERGFAQVAALEEKRGLTRSCVRINVVGVRF